MILVVVEESGPAAEHNIDKKMVFVPDGTAEEAILQDDSIGGMFEAPQITLYLEGIAESPEIEAWRVFTG